ncbi:uncharacterized protein LOC110249816 [Exaiptasia diaphana]|uniref:Uncharacterized protein n=1 Tax=Exaiptasia diaphana TaxID=2652724 RepID=A0A913Y096_EXADI|nr:uncharacterized protein LOC110249816 [Exaiptasia diaphana]KXJ23802.1 hypothetical protein AC249_AIPGENE11216 [Exaiptasia diaphana]
MMHVTPRRPGLRKPTIPSHKPPPSTDIQTNVNHGLQKKLMMLDQHDEALKNEIVASLEEGLITASECLQLFINTAWKDRNNKPHIAELFHKITQETDADFSLLIDSKCNNLLKVLTVLGKPTISDLSMVTLLANLYHIKDLPSDHKDGLEMYLIDIAKAFWPYFMPEKNSSIWNDDVCDCVCDVLMTVGRTLNEKCPINMERSFNNITIMMFSSCTISSYTLLRFLELKELRAANWCLTNTAKSYYRSAYSKHDRSNSCNSNSPVSQSSLDDDDDDDDDVFNNEQYKVTISKNHLKNGLNHPVVVHVLECKNPIDSNQATLTERPELTKNFTCEDEEIQLAQPVTSMDVRPDNPLDHTTLSDTNTSFGNNAGFSNQSSFYDSHVDLTLHGSTSSSNSENIVHGPQGFPGSISSRGGFPCPGSSTSLLRTLSENDSNFSSNDAHVRPQGFPGSTSSPGGFPCPGSSSFLPRTLSENDRNPISNGTHLRPQGFPGNTSTQGGFPKPWNHPFQRTLSESDNTCDRNVEQFRPHGFPDTNFQGGFPRSSSRSYQRTMSENGSNDNEQNRPQGFPGSLQVGFPRQTNHHFLKRAFSENDSMDNVGGFPRIQRQNSQDRSWKCMLEFPVQEENGSSDTNSRLYLLSFATNPSSLERPADLTLTQQLQEEKPWLRDVVLNKPVTVLDRFGRITNGFMN